ncbi:MAG TPA: TolC family protein, partial [Gemmatimonadaceae bacterium]|nr:TolC family protein [Gemmatimonadaceae bacterium]
MRTLLRATPLLVFFSVTARSQEPVTRKQAVESAIARSARAAVARADTLVGSAQLVTARQWENPSLAATYSKAVPHFHEIIDLPLDLTGVRSARIRSAEATRLASQYRFHFERAAAALDADTTYTRALASAEHLRLARRNAKDADSLRRMSIVRRDAGDASELDVLLASVNAGQAANQAATDSLTYVSNLFDRRDRDSTGVQSHRHLQVEQVGNVGERVGGGQVRRLSGVERCEQHVELAGIAGVAPHYRHAVQAVGVLGVATGEAQMLRRRECPSVRRIGVKSGCRALEVETVLARQSSGLGGPDA